MTTPVATRAGSSPLIDPVTLLQIRNLEWRARTVVEGTRSGLHRSPYHGFSVEFTEYRQYTPGDDLRHLDWRVYARTDRYQIKRFEDETNLRCHLMIDQSRSMTFGKNGHTKALYAATLAATFAYFLHLQGDAIGLITFDTEIRDHLPPRSRPGHFRRLLHALDKPSQGVSTDLSVPLARFREMVNKRSLLILISDFLAPLDHLESSLGLWLAGGHEVVWFQILDRQELTFDFTEATRLQDLETEREIALDPAAVRSDYLRRFGLHNEAVRQLCERRGVGFRQIITDQPLELALLGLLEERSRSSRHAIRRMPDGNRA